MSFFITTIITLAIGSLGGFLYIKCIYPNIFGGLKIAIFIGAFGSILGGVFFDFIFKTPLLKWLQNIPYIKYLLVNQVDVNFIAVFLGTWIFLSIYEYASEHTERS